MNAIYPLTIYYDASCALCSAEMRNLQARDRDEQLRFIDASAEGFTAFPPGTDRKALMTLIHATRADGTTVRGVEVFRLAYTAAGLPVVAKLTRLPGLKALSEAIYPLIARNRYLLPSAPMRWLFERSLQRAARRSAQRLHCAEGNCQIDAPRPEEKAS